MGGLDDGLLTRRRVGVSHGLAVLVSSFEVIVGAFFLRFLCDLEALLPNVSLGV